MTWTDYLFLLIPFTELFIVYNFSLMYYFFQYKNQIGIHCRFPVDIPTEMDLKAGMELDSYLPL